MGRFTLVAAGMVFATALGASTGGAQDVQQDQRDLRRDTRGVRQDRRDVRGDRRDLGQDRRELRQDLKSGHLGAATAERADIRKDRRELSRDLHARWTDHRDVRHDRAAKQHAAR
jgi:hypothetical protein